MQEEWKEYPFDCRYKVSNLGNVKGIKGKLLKPWKSGKYLYISLGRKNKILLHRLIMITFCFREDYQKMQVNHKDGNPENNNLNNLEWVTPSENILHSYNVLKRKAACQNAKKVNQKKVYSLNIETGEKLYFESQTDCALFYGCDKSNLTKYIDTEKVWKKYNIVIRRLAHKENFQTKY